MVLLIISGYANLCGFFKLVWFQGSSTLQRVSVLHSFSAWPFHCVDAPLLSAHSSDDWHLGCSQLQAVVNNAAASLLEYAFLILLGIYLKVGSLDHVSFMFLTFFGSRFFQNALQAPLHLRTVIWNIRYVARCSWQSLWVWTITNCCNAAQMRAGYVDVLLRVPAVFLGRAAQPRPRHRREGSGIWSSGFTSPLYHFPALWPRAEFSLRASVSSSEKTSVVILWTFCLLWVPP